MISQFLFLLFVIPISSVVLTLLIKQRVNITRATRLPPGPKKLPLVGNLHQLKGNSPHESLQQLSKDHGPLMFLQLGSIPTLVISSADVARDIFKSHDLYFSGRPQLYAGSKFSYNCCNITFAPYGEYWREVRKIAVQELLSMKSVQAFQAVRNEEVALMIDAITRSSKAPINMSRLIFLFVNSIISRVAFGRRYDSGADTTGTRSFDILMRDMQALMGESSIADFFPWMGWLNRFNGREARVMKCFTELDRFYDEEILKQHLDPRRPKPEHEDLVDVLLRVQKDSSQAISLSNDQIKSLFTDILVAGTDTSSATLVWTMTELIRNPSVLKRAQNEVRKIVKGEKKRVEEEDLAGLVFLKLVLKEALRLHPPAPLLVPRETTEDCTVGEYRIPRGARVIINAKAIATDPEYWENPTGFQPERFLNSSVDFRGQDFELIPFGIGRRGCPGMNFAIPLMELALANLLYRFDWELPPGMRIGDLDMKEASGITMHKESPLSLVATPAVQF